MSTPLRTSSRRVGSVVAFAALALAALFVPGRADAAPSEALNASGPYSASATAAELKLTVVDLTASGGNPLGDLLTQVLQGLTLPGQSVAALTLDPTRAAVDSDGPIGGDPTQRSNGFASNLDPNQKNLLDTVGLANALTTVERTAPKDQPPSITDDLLAVPLSPLLTADVAPATATANWAGDGQCPASDSPISQGRVNIAQATVLPGAIPGDPAGDLLNLGNGVSYVQSTTSLPNIGGTSRAVASKGEVQLGEINLFGGKVRIGVQPATLTATASGLPGGAGWEYTQPTLVDLNDNHVLTQADVDSLVNGALAPVFGGLAPLLDVKLTFTPSSTGAGSADGTTVAKDLSVATLTVSILDAAGPPGLNLLTLDLVPLHADANAPLGGITCADRPNPVKIGKTASKAEVTPGESFTYAITFTNTDPECTLTNTSLTDVITGPAGSTVEGTDPTATSVDGLTVTWGPTVVGDLAPGQSKTFTITVKVPTTAVPGDSYDDTATGAGDCGGVHYQNPFTLNDIPKVVTGLLARTGSDSTFPLIGAFALALAALGFRRLRRA